MNLRSFIFIPVAGLLAGTALHADPFTYESGAELSSTLDANGDGKTDLIIVDKATGVRQLALQQSDGTFLWLDPISVGLDNVTSLAVGSFTPASASQGFAVASPDWNRVQVWPAGSVAPVSASPPGIGPNTVVAVDVFGLSSSSDGIDDLAITTEFDDPPGSGMLGATYWNGTVAAPNVTQALVAPFFHGNRARFSDLEPWMVSAIQTSSSGSTFVTRPASPINPGPGVSSLSAGTTWIFGNFDGTHLTQFLFYAPGSSLLTVRPVIQTGAGHFNFNFGTGGSFDLGTVIAQIAVIPKTTGAQLLVIFTDGTTAKIYDFDGTHAPVLRETLTAPSGGKFSLAGALGGGNFLLLNGPSGGSGGSTGWQRWNFNGTNHSLAASGVLPSGSIPNTQRANVLVYGDDPGTAPDAPLLKVLQAGQWSVTAAFQGGVLEVTSQRSLGALPGLGAPSLFGLGSGFDADFPQLNQTGSDTSLAMISPAVGQPAGEIVFSPQPGTYHLSAGETLTVRISATPDLPVYFRTGSSGSWTGYDPAAPPEITVTTTFRAYAGTANGSVDDITPIRTAVYTIAPAPVLVPPSSTDADGNGLADAWEKALGISDPNGDADGDGVSNRDEYLAGTDPLDSASRPGSSDLSAVQLTFRAPGPSAPAGTLVDVVWPSSFTGAKLQSNADPRLQNAWIPVTGSFTTSGSERIYHYPAAAGNSRLFFRLIQSP